MFSVGSFSRSRFSQSRFSIAKALLAFLLLLVATAFITMPASGQNDPSPGAEPVLSERAIGAPRPERSPQPSSSEARSVQAGSGGQLDVGLQVQSLDLADARLGTSERDSVLRPVPSGRSLRDRLQTTVRQSALDAHALQGRNGPRVEPTSIPPHRRRWDAFRGEVISVQFISSSVLGGTLEHLTGSPDALNRDTRGYLARVGTNAASRLTYAGVQHGVSAALGIRLKSPEPRGSLGARLKQAALQTLTTRTTSGQRLPAVAETAGTYGAILTRGRLYYGQWRPGRAATSTAVAIGVKVVWATGKELVGAL